jgi:hypothetical protein
MTYAELSKMKAKILVMLAKAESSEFPEERDLFNAGAEKLMIRLGITAAELEAAGEVQAEKVIEVNRTYPGEYSIAMLPLVNSVAHGFGHITILQGQVYGTLSRKAFIIGHESDVEQFTVLLDSIALQVKSALRRYQKENREERRWLSDRNKHLQSRSFIEGFGAKVGERLLARRTTEEVGVSTGTALVLASKEARIADWMSENYPSLKQSPSHKYSRAGYTAGSYAGATASLNDPSLRRGQNGELAS